MLFPRCDKDSIAKKKRTSSCAMGVCNLGPSARRPLLQYAGGASEDGVGLEMDGDDSVRTELRVEVDGCSGLIVNGDPGNALDTILVNLVMAMATATVVAGSNSSVLPMMAASSCFLFRTRRK